MNNINDKHVFICTSKHIVMKRFIFSLFILSIFSFYTYSQTTHTVNINGFTFVPSSLNITVGDIVNFNGNSNHPILEVSMDTWNSNGSTALPGGFAFPTGVGEKMFNAEGTHYYICENHISSGMKGQITVSMPTSNEDIIPSDFISIYPNPLIDDILKVSFERSNNSPLYVVIFDITGKSRISTIFNSSNDEMHIDCSNLSSGMYIVQFSVDNQTKTSKLIKE